MRERPRGSLLKVTVGDGATPIGDGGDAYYCPGPMDRAITRLGPVGSVFQMGNIVLGPSAFFMGLL